MAWSDFDDAGKVNSIVEKPNEAQHQTTQSSGLYFVDGTAPARAHEVIEPSKLVVNSRSLHC